MFLKHWAFDNALGESYREDRTPKIGPGPQVTPDVAYVRERGLDYKNGGGQGDFIEVKPRWFSNYLTHLVRDNPDYRGQT